MTEVINFPTPINTCIKIQLSKILFASFENDNFVYYSTNLEHLLACMEQWIVEYNEEKFLIIKFQYGIEWF